MDIAKHRAGRKSRAFAGLGSVPASALLFIAAFGLLLSATSARAVDVPLDSIAQIRFDDDGEKLNYPVAVFFDPVMEETYLVNGGNNRVVVYGPDFFPRISMGIGRNVIAPRGVMVLPNGEVYLCQVRTYKNPSPRLTVLNAAFFVDREIFLDQVPEAADFMPKQLAISSQDLIYLAGNDERSVLVFDDEGNFLRKLRVMDDVSLLSPFRKPEYQQTEDASPDPDGEQPDGEQPDGEQLEVDTEKQSEQGTAKESTDGEPVAITAEEDDFLTNIPKEFRPRRKRQDEALGIVDGKGPVKINAVMIDSGGRIYLLSAETGRIYVHGPDEAFLFSFGTPGGSPGQLSQPRSMAIDENRQLIYVVDYMRHTVLAYNLDGEFLFELGGRGVAPGWFNFPVSIAVNSNGQILVADLFNRRLQVLDVGYEEALPYLELERAQGEEVSIEADQPEEPAASSQFESVNGIETGTEPEPEIKLELEREYESGSQPEEEVDSADESEPEPDPDPDQAAESEPLDIIIEEVIIEEAEPAGFSADGREPETPSNASPPGATAGE